MPALLWGARIVLLVMVVLHIWSSVQLAVRNNQCAAAGICEEESGRIVVCVADHVLERAHHPGVRDLPSADFTFGKVNPHFQQGNVYGNVVASFQVHSGSGVLHHRDGAAVPASVSRAVEHVSIARDRASALDAIVAQRRGCAGDADRGRKHFDTSGGDGGVGEIAMQLDARVPLGEIEKLWDQARFEMKLVNPANKRKHTIIVVGSGLAGASAAATLGRARLQRQVLLLSGFTPARA